MAKEGATEKIQVSAPPKELVTISVDESCCKEVVAAINLVASHLEGLKPKDVAGYILYTERVTSVVDIDRKVDGVFYAIMGTLAFFLFFAIVFSEGEPTPPVQVLSTVSLGSLFLWGGIKIVNNLRLVINTPWQVVAIIIVAITVLHALAEVPTLLSYFCH